MSDIAHPKRKKKHPKDMTTDEVTIAAPLFTT